jgi:ABC-type glycerol-3-phosphate transport system permease component
MTARREISPRAWRARRAAATLVPTGILGVLTLAAVFPLFWMALSSLKTYETLYAFPPRFNLDELGWHFYKAVLDSTPFLSFIKNSAIVATASTAIGTLFAAMAAYALTRARFRGARALTNLVLVAYIFPPVLIAIPLFLVINRVGLANTHAGLILVHIVYTFPFSTWMLRSFFARVPIELEEAARIDGADQLTIFFKVALPLVAPGIVAVSVFAFISSWNEFLLSLIILGAGANRTLSVGLYSLVGGEFAQWGPAMAAATLAILPTLVLFLLIQHKIAAGMTAGSVKG